MPEAGWYREILNSDAELYGGSHMGNGGGIHTEPVVAHGHEHSLRLTVPPPENGAFIPALRIRGRGLVG